MKTKTLIEKQTKKKSNVELVKTIIAAKKNKGWLEVAGILSGSRKKRKSLNLEEINKESKDKEVILIPGKVLSQGEIDKKIKIIAFGFSEKAKQKLKEAKIDFKLIIDEIKSNPQAKEIKVLK